MSRPICEGLNVVELGSGSIAASLAGMMFADNGAHVVKIEPPEGDALRTRLAVRLPRVEPRQGERVYTTSATESGRAARARTGRAGRHRASSVSRPAGPTSGVSATSRCAPSTRGLVYCSITGFGSTGPYARLKAYEGVVQAKIGAYSRGHVRLP